MNYSGLTLLLDNPNVSLVSLIKKVLHYFYNNLVLLNLQFFSNLFLAQKYFAKKYDELKIVHFVGVFCFSNLVSWGESYLGNFGFFFIPSRKKLG